MTAAPLDLVLLEAGCVMALSLALFSGHFSVWPRYLVNGRQVAGLCHLVPVLACFAALLPPVAGVRRTRTARRSPRSALLVAALIASGALAAALNPVLVPLQAVLCGVALLTAALRRQVTWSGLGPGLAIGGAFALAVVASDPYLSRRANLPGLRPPPAPYLAAVQADFARGLHRPQLPDARVHRPRPRVPGRARRRPRAAARPHRGGVRAPVHAAGAAPLRPARARPSPVPRPDRHRPRARPRPSPRRTCSRCCPGCSPLRRSRRAIAGCSPPPARSRRRSPSTRGSAACCRALTDPDDPGLRLLPYYTDTAAAILFTQVLWPLLLVATAFIGAGRDTPRRRWLRLAAAAAVLVPLAVTAAGPVARGMALRRILDEPSRADLDALDRLEARLDARRRRLPRRGAGRPIPAESAGSPRPTTRSSSTCTHGDPPCSSISWITRPLRRGRARDHLRRAAGAARARTLVRRHRARWALAVATAGQAVPDGRPPRCSAAGRCASGSRRCGRPAATAA